MTHSQDTQINRWLVAMIAVGCLVCGIVIAIRDSPNNVWCGGCIRVGVLMAVFWFCLPSRGRAAAWANFNPWWVVGAAAVLLIVKQTRVVIALAVILAVVGVILPLLTRPRK